jgi:hypothetical protein
MDEKIISKSHFSLTWQDFVEYGPWVNADFEDQMSYVPLMFISRIYKDCDLASLKKDFENGTLERKFQILSRSLFPGYLKWACNKQEKAVIMSTGKYFIVLKIFFENVERKSLSLSAPAGLRASELEDLVEATGLSENYLFPCKFGFKSEELGAEVEQTVFYPYLAGKYDLIINGYRRIGQVKAI